MYLPYIGSEDYVLNYEKYNENKQNLLYDFVEAVIEGGCHAEKFKQQLVMSSDQDVMKAYNMAVENSQANKIAVAEVEKILRTLGN